MAEQLTAAVSLWLDGELVEDVDDRLLLLEVDERAASASAFRLVLSMAPGDDGEWDLLRADTRWSLLRRLTIGFRVQPPDETTVTAERIVFDGYITIVAPTFGEQRVPESKLELRGLDASCLMHLEARHRTWRDQSDSAIVRQLFGDYGFGADVDEQGPVRHEAVASMHQRGTDAEFMRQLARRHGWECNVRPVEDAEIEAAPHPGRGVVGHFHPPRVEDTQPLLTLAPADAPSLKTMSARWDSHRPTRMEAWHIDAFSRRMQHQSWPKDPPRPVIPKMGRFSRQDLLDSRLGELRGRLPTSSSSDGEPRTLQPRGFQARLVPHDNTEVDQLAWADHLQSDWLAEAEATVQGLRYDGIVQPGKSVPIAGGGELVDGDWYVRSARHRWEAGQATQAYEIDLHLVRNALGEVEDG